MTKRFSVLKLNLQLNIFQIKINFLKYNVQILRIYFMFSKQNYKRSDRKSVCSLRKLKNL